MSNETHDDVGYGSGGGRWQESDGSLEGRNFLYFLEEQRLEGLDGVEDTPSGKYSDTDTGEYPTAPE